MQDWGIRWPWAPAVLSPVYFSVALSQALGSYPGKCGAVVGLPQEAQDGNSSHAPTCVLIPREERCHLGVPSEEGTVRWLQSCDGGWKPKGDQVTWVIWRDAWDKGTTEAQSQL